MNPTVTPKQLTVYTVAEAAGLLGVTPQTVYRWLDDGTLTECTTRRGTVRLVDAGSADRLQRQRERDAVKGRERAVDAAQSGGRG